MRTSHRVTSAVLSAALATGGLLAVGGTAQAAAAAPPTTDPTTLLQWVQAQPDPAAAVGSLSAAQRAAITRYLTPTGTTAVADSMTSTSPATTAPPPPAGVASPYLLAGGKHVSGESCWYEFHKWGLLNSVGNTLATYWTSLNWCGKNGAITSWSVGAHGAETKTPGWQYDGHGSDGTNNVGWELREYTQEKFSWGVPSPWGPIGGDYVACAQIRGGASGLYWTQDSCNL